MKLKKKKAFTLIELLLVLAIIGLLTAVAVPKYGDLLEKANAGATLGNLAALRSAVSMYYASNIGFPFSISAQEDTTFEGNMSGNTPYVRVRYPKSNPPYGNQITKGASVPTDMGTGWYYNRAKGDIFINSTASDIKNMPYTTY